jgi:hypothetical protein
MKSRLRALLTLAASAGLAASMLLPGGALAGAAQKASDHYVEVFCDSLTGSDGTAFFGVTISDVNGVSGGLDVFGPNAAPFDPPIFTTDPEAVVTAAYSGGVFSASIPVLDGNGDPAGAAQLSATLESGGEPQPIDDNFKDGNHNFRSSGTFQPLAITTGSLILPDGSTFVLDNEHCGADHVDITFFGNNPASAVQQFDGKNISCDLVVGGQVVGNLFVDVDSDRSIAFIDAFLFDAGLDASTETPITNGAASASLTYVDINTGASVGSGAISLTLAATGERFSYTLNGGTQLVRVNGEVYDVTGTLTAPGFAPFDLSSCVLADFTSKRIVRPAHAPKPTGKAPANDLPSAAPKVRVKTTLTENTKNAALDMEAPYDCLTFIDDSGAEQPVPVIKTVWFAIDGTGSNVTFDTAGSGFDTVVAVYTKATDGSYVPVPGACVDDVPVQPLGRTLQAAVTFGAAAGTTYYVQIGGFPDDLNWGDLHLAVR